MTLTRANKGPIRRLKALNSIAHTFRAFEKLITTGQADFFVCMDGRLSTGLRRDIRSISTEIRITDVTEFFETHDLAGGSRHGRASSYIRMCEFFSFHVWSLFREYQLVCRVDDDVLIASCLPKGFVTDIYLSGAVQVFPQFRLDPHEESLETFVPWCVNELNRNPFAPNTTPSPGIPHFGSWFFIQRSDFWNSEPAASFLGRMRNFAGVSRHGWGDHIVQSAAFSAFSQPNQRLFADEISLTHGSHGYLKPSHSAPKPEWSLRGKEVAGVSTVLRTPVASLVAPHSPLKVRIYRRLGRLRRQVRNRFLSEDQPFLGVYAPFGPQ